MEKTYKAHMTYLELTERSNIMVYKNVLACFIVQ